MYISGLGLKSLAFNPWNSSHHPMLHQKYFLTHCVIRDPRNRGPPPLFNVQKHQCIVWISCWKIAAAICLCYTARPRDTRILVPEKNRAAQNRASWGLYLCTKWDFFYKNRVSSRLLFKIRASWGYTYVLKGIFIDFFLAYLAIWSFFNWDLWTIGTFGQLGPSSNWEFGCLGNWDLWTIGDSWIILDQKDAQNKNKV